MNIETFFTSETLGTLLLIAVLTVLTVEAMKRVFTDTKLYNIMALCSSLSWTVLIALSVLLRGGVVVTPSFILNWVIIGILSAIISMTGYDKFIQLLTQAKDKNSDQ